MISFLGPIPPPVHGFSVINQKMLALLKEKADVRIVNSSGRQTGRWASKNAKFRAVAKCMGFLTSLSLFIASALVRRTDTLYVGLSGGVGQIFDSLFIICARLFGAKIYIHHHSFVYLNEVKLYNRFFFWAAAGSYHIALCDEMAARLASTYSIAGERILTLSNAAFLETKPSYKVAVKSFGGEITLGFLSNIILEKGIVEFFDVVASLTQQGMKVKGIVAGPVDPALEEEFNAMLADYREVEYVGAVYDAKKDAFFQRIDFLLFPTKYRNEAEPLTILEALRAGVPVLAAGRGCIRSMVTTQSGQVFPEIQHFVSDVSEYLKSVLTGVIPLQALSENAIKQFDTMHTLHAERLGALVDRIAFVEPSRKHVRA